MEKQGPADLLACFWLAKKIKVVVMELLDRLEQRVESLLVELTELREENRMLRAKGGDCSHLEEENLKLREELDQERALRETILARVDALLGKLKDETGEA